MASSLPPGQTDDGIEAAHLVAAELTRWEAGLRPLWTEWDRQWARWEIQSPNPDLNPFLSQVQSPWGMHAVEVVLSKLVGQNPGMDYKPLTDKDDYLIAKIAGKVATWQMAKMGFEGESRDFLRQALVTNYSVAKVGWVRTTREVDGHDIRIVPIAENRDIGNVSIRQPTRRIEVVKNQPFFETVNVKDFVWPLTAKSIDHATAVWQRTWPTLEELHHLADIGVYQNVDQVTAMDSARWLEAYSAQFESQGLTPNAIDSYDLNQGAKNRVEVWERWEDDRLTVIANRRVLLRDEPNPFNHKRKPYVDYTPIPRPFQLQGLGLMKVTEDLNEQLNTSLRQVSDAVTFTIAPMFKHTEGVDWEGVTIGPGERLPVPDTEDVQPLIMPTIDMASMAELRQFLVEEMQRGTGAFELIGGAFPVQGSRTATGMNIIVQEGSRRITEMLNVFEQRTMKRLGYLMLSMNEQYMDDSVVVNFSDDPSVVEQWKTFAKDYQEPSGFVDKVKGRFARSGGPQDNGLVTITPEMLRPNGLLEPVPEVGQDKETDDAKQRSDVVQWVQALAPILSNPQNPINMSELARLISQKFDIDPEEITKLLQTDPLQMQQRMMEAQGGSGQTSGPGGGDNRPMGGVVGAPGAAGPG